MSKTTKYLLIGGAVVLVVLLIASAKSSSTNVRTTTYSGGAGYVAASGSIIGALANGYKTIFSGSSASENGDYVPNIAHGDDITLGG
jgi:hypothetical protein